MSSQQRFYVLCLLETLYSTRRPNAVPTLEHRKCRTLTVFTMFNMMKHDKHDERGQVDIRNCSILPVYMVYMVQFALSVYV